jgi:hypothetical protein
MGAPFLDHLSLAGPPGEFERLGFCLTPTRGAPSHARILLERSYVEVTPADAKADGLTACGWFLRPDNLEQAAQALRNRGISVTGPQPYEGADGTWLDLMLAGPTTTLLPTLTRRLDRPAEAWPPSLESPHPNGAVALKEVRLRSREPAMLIAVLDALGAGAAGPGRFELEAGTAISIEDSPGPEGFIAVAVAVEREGGSSLMLDLALQPLG